MGDLKIVCRYPQFCANKLYGRIFQGTFALEGDAKVVHTLGATGAARVSDNAFPTCMLMKSNTSFPPDYSYYYRQNRP